jgi:uncharacterized protein
MLKLLIWITLGYMAYRAVIKWLGGGAHRQSRMPGPNYPQVDDIMIKDPECGSYFPRRSGVMADVNGNSMHFCSAECRDRYLARP